MQIHLFSYLVMSQIFWYIAYFNFFLAVIRRRKNSLVFLWLTAKGSAIHRALVMYILLKTIMKNAEIWNLQSL
jgi:DNA-binding protein